MRRPFPDLEVIMITSIARSALVAGLLFAAGGAAVNAQTLGEKLSSGQLSEGALVQLISGTGLTEEEALGLTLEDIVAIKWQDD